MRHPRTTYSAREADALFSHRWAGLTNRAVRAAKPKPPRPAAGVLLRHTDTEANVWYMLGLRCERLGGTWSNIGGSLEPDEDPLVGALRELWEECGIDVADLAGSQLATTIQCGTESVPYTLFVIDVPTLIDSAELGWENDELFWFLGSDVATLELHAGFARAWEVI